MDRDAIRARGAAACDHGEVLTVGTKRGVGFGALKSNTCGTPASYQKGCHCVRCTAAHSARQRIYRNQKARAS